MITEKPFAPRPVKKNSNKSAAIRIDTGFENISKFNSNSSSSQTRKSSINFEQLLSPEISRIKCKNFIKVEEEFCIFKNELSQNLSEESAKSEIISILNKNDSTFFTSFNGNTESCLSEENRLTTNVYEDEIIKLNLPPIRISNPVYKNFYSSDDEDEVDLNVFNFTSKLFDRAEP